MVINNPLNVTVCESYFLNNGHFCKDEVNDPVTSGGLLVLSAATALNIDVVRTQFFSNRGAAFFFILSKDLQLINLIEIFVCDNIAKGDSDVAGVGVFGGTNIIKVFSSLFCSNAGSSLWLFPIGNFSSVIISNSSFINNTPSQRAVATVGIFPSASQNSSLTLVDAQIVNCSTLAHSLGGGTVYIRINNGRTHVNLTRVCVISNNYAGDMGAAVYVNDYDKHGLDMSISECQFVNNSSPGIGAALYINTRDVVLKPNIMISNCIFHENYADDSIIFLVGSYVLVTTSNFTSNIGSSIHLFLCNIVFELILFINNTASNGAAIYVDQESIVAVATGAVLHFTNNIAIQHGGAIYVNLPYNCPELSFFEVESNSAIFTNNSAEISGNSIYFSIPKLCQVDTNISSPKSILNTPCQFNFSDYSHGNTTYHNCTFFSGAESPIVMSPNELRLYFPNNDVVTYQLSLITTFTT